MTAATLKRLERAIRHPEFKYCTAGHDVPIVFVFGRNVFKTPTTVQLAEYDRCEAVVKENGGLMRLQRWETAGRNPSFSRADVKAALNAVKSAHPSLDVYTYWNGCGYYSLSIGARHAHAPRKGAKRKGRR